LLGLFLVSTNDKVVVVVDVWDIDDAWDGNKVDWDSVAPPELSGDAPWLDVFKPLVPGLLMELRLDL